MKKINCGDIVVITGIGKHKQVDYSWVKEPKLTLYHEMRKNKYKNNIGSLGYVMSAGRFPYHWVSISDEHNMFLHLDKSEFKVIDNLHENLD